MFVSAPKSNKINKLSNSEPHIKKRFTLHFDSHFVSSYGKFRGHLVFFLSNLLVSNVWSYSTMLPQIRHIIVNMFSSILRVTVKTADVLDLKVK